ncbi:hypothetical protein HMPREF1051_2882 [Neisseria sicca VK64]|uniref:Uncharacterized protein n=1 Tax=Neisseria sicca VK64 TaxID=1095748 RepID=I2NWX3_NEISI|nr:hypothetical protein HMPREF1051_2882 [Neisseria sicca VK64]
MQLGIGWQIWIFRRPRHQIKSCYYRALANQFQEGFIPNRPTRPAAI